MMTLLLIINIFVFISLGIPDSALGAAWPAIYSDFKIPIGTQSLITFLISAGTITASFFSAKLINKFGTGKITCFSTLLTAIALLGFTFSSNLIYLCICSIPLGIGAGAIDAALNNFAATHFKSFHINMLHCFYGLGVSVTPLIFSAVFKIDNNWQLGYLIIFLIQSFITLTIACTLPIWKKVQKTDITDNNCQPITLKFKELLHMPAVRIAWFAFFFTCALEFACNNWIPTYLVNIGEISKSTATGFASLYFLGIIIGRLLSGLISNVIGIKRVTIIGYSCILICIIIQFLPLSTIIKGCAFFLIGFGNGPTFPNFTYITPKRFGNNYSQSIISSQMVACNLGVMLSPIIFGIIAQNIGITYFPYYLAVLFACMIFSTCIYDKRLKQNHGKGL